jgi:hypothetical protein
MLTCPADSFVYASRTARGQSAVSFSVSPRALWLMHSAAKPGRLFRSTRSAHAGAVGADGLGIKEFVNQKLIDVVDIDAEF